MSMPSRIGYGLVLAAVLPAFAYAHEATDESPGGAKAMASPSGQPVVMSPESGDVLWFFQESPEKLGSGGELRIYLDHATHAEARGSFAKFTLGVGGALPVHRHDKTEEIAYIISGEGVAVGLDDAGNEVEMPVSEGYVWYNPPSVWHAVRNTGSVPLTMVFATIPNEEKGLLAFFRNIGVEPGQAAKPIPADEFARLAQEHDMILRPQTPASDKE